MIDYSLLNHHKNDNTTQEKAGLERGIKKDLKYQLGYCYKCLECKTISRVHLSKHKRSLSERFHLNKYHPKLSHADLKQLYAYGLFDSKIVVFMNQKDFLLFMGNPKIRNDMDNMIEKRIEKMKQ